MSSFFLIYWRGDLHLISYKINHKETAVGNWATTWRLKKMSVLNFLSKKNIEIAEGENPDVPLMGADLESDMTGMDAAEKISFYLQI